MANKKTLELQIQVLMQQAQQQIKTFSGEIKSAAEQVKKLSQNNTDVKKSISQVQTEAKRAAGELNTFASQGEISISNLTKDIGNLATVAAAVSFDKWVGNLATSALQASTSFRAAKEEFGIMLGDMQAGAGLFAELQEFNYWTPFNMEQISQATKVLMAAKVPLQDIIQYLTIFGDISQGNGQKFQSFINAFSKSSAKGKADMEVLNVYIDQGVQILDELGKQMGVTSGEIVKMASEGKISFQNLDTALSSLAAEGGLYYNSMATASQRLDAVQAGLKESTNALAASFGDMLAPMIAKALESLTNLVNAINESPFLKGVLAAALSAIVVIINTQMIRALVAFAAKIWATYAAQMSLTSALSITNPLLLAGIAAVAAATAGYVAYAAAQEEAAKQTAELALQKKKLDESFENSMQNMSATDAYAALQSYEVQLATQKTILQQYQEKLKNTPEITYEHYNNGRIEEVRNDDFYNLKNKISETEPKIKELEQKIAAASARIQELKNENMSAELERANKILEHRDTLYKSTTQYQREQLEQELKFAESLKILQTMDKDGTYSGFDLEKTDAIIENLKEKIHKLDNSMKSVTNPEFSTKWQDEFLTDIEKIEKEWDKASKKLFEEGKNKFGPGFLDEPAYIAELTAMDEHFKNIIDKMNEEGKVTIKTVVKAAKEGAMNALSGTELGQVAQGFQQGELAGGVLAALKAFIGAVIKAVSELENGQKVLNFISTIVEKIFDQIGPLVDDALKPTVQFLELFGTALGKLLKPFAYMAKKFAESETFLKTFIWILEYVIDALEIVFQVLQPIIDVISKILKIFGYVVNPLGIAADAANKYAEQMQTSAEELEKQNEMLRKKYERQAQVVEDLLQSQLESLRSQYELGLITREEYEQNAEKYSSAADSKIYDINKQMEEHLENIDANTSYAFYDKVDSGIQKSKSVIGEIAKWVLNPIGALGNLFGWWDVGSYNIPQDQVGMVHQGEIIVPRTFAEGIRSGELTLGSKNSNEQSSVYVVVNVAGSVTTEQELTTAIYNGIAQGIQNKKYTPFPVGY